jgi:hypothetical protein
MYLGIKKSLHNVLYDKNLYAVCLTMKKARYVSELG